MKFVSSCKNNPSHEFDYIIEKKKVNVEQMYKIMSNVVLVLKNNSYEIYRMKHVDYLQK